MLRTTFSLWLVVLVSLVARAADSSPALILLDDKEARAIREALARRDPAFAAAGERLRAAAEAALRQGPWSVTRIRPAAPGIPLHSYYSEAPYWWPDPAHPDGPYIRRDGETNPDRFTAHMQALSAMSQAVLATGAAAYFFDDARYAARAAELIRVWCLDPETRMTPDFEYSQAVRGRNTGRGAGIVSSRGLIQAAQGLSLLEATGKWDPHQRDGVRAWFRQYLDWMTKSRKGRDEGRSGNNHETWWAAQLAAYAAFTGDHARITDVARQFRERLLAQIRADGSAPREEARTKSLSYSMFNLEAFATLCRIEAKQGLDLWQEKNPAGGSLQRAIEYLLPFLEDPKKWQGQQIVDVDTDRPAFLAWAGLALKRPQWVAWYRRQDRPAQSPQTALLDLILAAEGQCCTATGSSTPRK